jgi:DNA integrity scanning protein DisA with diadenylate cyclase activity
MVINPPVLTILEPVVDGSNVTLNGNLNAGSPGVTIKSVSVDWNDGTATQAADLPVSHHYPSFGIFTVVITGYQSDGQSTTKRITLEIDEEVPTVPGPGPSAPPPNNDSPLYLIALATAIIVMAIVIVGQWIMQKNKGTYEEPESQKGFSPRNGKMSENLPSPEDLSTICAGTDVTPDVLEPVVRVAMEIAREGREGQAIGTSFVVGDTKNVMNHSKQFVLNPFHGYHEADRRITDEGIRGNIKEFAQLDGAFLITDTGVVEAAGRCITVDMSQVNLPGGLGSRHSSIAGITKVTKSIGIVVSQSGGMISIFRDGKIVYTIKS